jgi:hypothetical protein
MTFIVGGDGIVHEKDLGKRTEAVGKAIRNTTPTQAGENPKACKRKAQSS